MIANNLGHAPFQSGSIIRDKRDNKDHVILHIVAFTAGLGGVLYCTSLVGQNITEFKNEDFRHLMTIKTNPNQMPLDVKARYNLKVSQSMRGNQELIGLIHKPENQILKDLLFVAGESSEQTFDKTLVELSKSIVYAGQGIPTKTAIRHAIETSAGPDTTKEFIDYLVDRIFQESKTQERIRVGAGKERFLTPFQSRYVPDFIRLDNRNGLQSSDEKAIRYARASNQFTRSKSKLDYRSKLTLNKEEQGVLDLLLGERGELRGGLREEFPELGNYGNAEERLDMLLKGMFNHEVHAEIKKDLLYHTKRGNKTILSEAILKSDYPAIRKSWNIINTNKTFDVGNRVGFLNDLKQRNSGRSVYNIPDRAVMRGIPDFEKFIIKPNKDPNIGFSNLLSIDTPTLLDHVLSNKKLTLNGIVVDADNKIDRELIRKHFDFKNKKQVFFTPSELRKTLERKEINLNTIRTQDRIIRKQVENRIFGIELEHGAYGKSGFVFNGSMIKLFQSEKEQLRKRNITVRKLSFNDKVRLGSGLPKVESGSRRLFVLHTNEIEGNSQTFIGNPEQVLNSIYHLNQIEPDINKLPIDLDKSSLSLKYIDVPTSHYNEIVNKPLSPISKVYISDAQSVFNTDHFPDLNLRTKPGIEEAVSRIGGLRNIEHRSTNLEAEITRSYQESKEAQRLSISRIKTKEGHQFKLMGTDLPTSFETQIERAKQFYTGRNVAALDIERTIVNGEHTLTQLTLGVKNSTGIHFPVNFNNISSESQSIRAIVDLSHQIKKVKIVATQSDSDLLELVQMAGTLISKSNNAQEIIELKSAIRTFKSAFKNKLLQFETIGQIAEGTGTGNLRQGYLSAKYLEDLQEHTSLQDVKDMFSLASEMQADFHLNLGHLELDALKVHSPIMLDENPVSQHFGRLLQPHSIILGRDKTASIIFKEFDLNDTGLVETGNWVSDSGNSVAQLGYKFNSLTSFDQHNVEHVQSLTRSVTERSDRIIRSVLNPHSLTYDDPLGTHEGHIYDPFSRTELLVNEESFRVWNDIKHEINAVPKESYEFYNRNISKKVEIISQALASVPENLQERVKHQLTEMATNTSYSDVIAGSTSFSSVSDFHQSSFGQLLVDKARRGDSSIIDDEYGIFTDLFMGKVGKLHSEGLLEGLTKTESYGARLSLKFPGLDISSSKNIRGLGDYDAAEKASQDLSGKILTSFAQEHKTITDTGIKHGPLGEFMRELGHDPDHLKSVAESYAENRKLKNNLWNWKDAMSEIPFIGQNDTHSELRNAYFDILNSSKMDTIIETGMLENLEGDAHKWGQGVIKRAKDLQTTKKLPFRIAMSYSLRDELRSNEGFVKEAMSKQYEQLNLGTLLNLAHREILEETTDLQGRIRNHIDNSEMPFDELESFYKTIVDAKNLAHEQNLTGIELQTAGQRAVIDKYEKVLDGAQISPRPISSVEMLHNFSMEASNIDGNAGNVVSNIQHEMVMNTANMKPMSSMIVPLLAVGGVLGLIGATHKIKDKFSQGAVSNQQGDPISLSSEIPGNPDGLRVWHGETTPFRLDITFRGFVADKRHHDELVNQTYDALSGEMQFRNVHNRTIDKREKANQRKLRELIR